MDTMELRLLCETMAAIQTRKVALEAELAKVNKEFDLYRIVKIPEKMEELGMRNATFEGLGRVQLAPDMYASTREGMKEAAMLWLRDTGYADMVTETYHASSIKALFRRMLKEGQPIPDEIFDITPFVTARIVKA